MRPNAIVITEEEISEIGALGSHVVPDIHHRRRVIDAGFRRLVPCPWRGDRDVQRDARVTLPGLIPQQKPARDQTSHAVGDHMVLQEAVLQL